MKVLGKWQEHWAKICTQVLAIWMNRNKCTSEDSKREGEEKKPEDIFRRSEKVNRMPQKEKQDKEGKVNTNKNDKRAYEGHKRNKATSESI